MYSFQISTRLNLTVTTERAGGEAGVGTRLSGTGALLHAHYFASRHYTWQEVEMNFLGLNALY